MVLLAKPLANNLTPSHMLKCRNKMLDLSSPVVMGILNITPDSFYDGGRYYRDFDQALRKVESIINDGAQIIDIGGESTRPGALSVSLEEELDRVMPLVEKIHQTHDIVISIDTQKPQVMKEAIKAGAHMINDVYALRETGAFDAIQHSDVAVCLMHMQGLPRTMQVNPTYKDLMKEIISFLKERVAECQKHGIHHHSIVLDPGFGFGKTVEHNLELTNRLNEISKLGFPLLYGASRKSTIGKILNCEPADRLIGSVLFDFKAMMNGANILRSHDVRATVQAIKIFNALSHNRA